MTQFLFEECRSYCVYAQKRQTSRSPYIGSYCVLFATLTQLVIASVCFQTLFQITQIIGIKLHGSCFTARPGAKSGTLLSSAKCKRLRESRRNFALCLLLF